MACSENATDLLFDEEAAVNMYYSVPIMVTNNGQRKLIGDREFLVQELPGIGVTIGVDQEVRSHYKKRTILKETSLSKLSSTQKQDDEYSVFADGLAISIDERWSENKMEKDTIDRQS